MPEWSGPGVRCKGYNYSGARPLKSTGQHGRFIYSAYSGHLGLSSGGHYIRMATISDLGEVGG